jgi:hypothetical protein
MYCPECATQNIEPAKFCRVCGANLEAVSLALAGSRSSSLRQATTDVSVSNDVGSRKKERCGRRHLVQGSILLAASSLIALVGLAVSRGGFAWFPIWAVFFGWMACWGTVSVALGLGRLIEGTGTVRLISSTSKTTSSLEGPAPVKIFPASVTEHTTRQLEQKQT